MLTKTEADRIKRAAKRVANAEVQYAWRGAGHPDDIDAIEQERRDARKNLKRVVDDLTQIGPLQDAYMRLFVKKFRDAATPRA